MSPHVSETAECGNVGIVTCETGRDLETSIIKVSATLSKSATSLD